MVFENYSDKRRFNLFESELERVSNIPGNGKDKIFLVHRLHVMYRSVKINTVRPQPHSTQNLRELRHSYRKLRLLMDSVGISDKNGKGLKLAVYKPLVLPMMKKKEEFAKNSFVVYTVGDYEPYLM